MATILTSNVASMPRWVSSVERVIKAPAERLYPLVADPRRHKDIDGSGTVVAANDERSSDEELLSVGDEFGMDMSWNGKYSMTSTVIEADLNRRFAWQSRPHKDSSKWRFIFGGRIWRYEFEPVAEGTLVRESWDLHQEPLRVAVWGYKKQTRANMHKTLERMAEIAEAQ